MNPITHLTGFAILWMTVSSTAAQQVASSSGDDSSRNQENGQVIDQSALEQGSASQQLQRQFNLDEPGLTGILVDRTITMMGKTFFRDFGQLAMQSQILSRTTLTFHERPDARWGSQLWISEDRKVLFLTQLSPRLSDSEQMAHDAISIVEQRLLEQHLSSQLMPNRDLGAEEL